MKTRNLIRFASLLLGLGLGTIQPARGQSDNPQALFQYAYFYNGLLEFTDCAPLTINGRVHCNSNIFVGSPSGSRLTFNYLVTCTGTITNPAWFGIPQSYYVAANITYNGTPSPGYSWDVPQVSLPTGPSNSIIQLPGASDSPSNVISWQRYFYKADLVILVTNVTSTNVATSVILKNSMFDPAPLIFSYTNNVPQNTGVWTNMSTNWAWFGASNWLTTNATFYDARQNQTNLVTQIDVGRFGTWIATNTNCLAKWNAGTPFNGIIYVADLRTTNSMYMDCVRLTNGQTIPTVGATNSGSNSYTIPGLTVATINPLYILGLYNCPTSTNVGSTNTTGTQPCSVVCDALTILSPAWRDVLFPAFMPTASSSDTVNTAIIAGNVPSTGSSDTQFSGGAHNLVRLLENWAGSTFWLNTSFINLYPSAQATAQFLSPGIYYNPPTRNFSLDPNFSNPALLPPGTPLLYNIPTTIVITNLTQVYNGEYLYPTVYSIPTGPRVIVSFPTVSGGGLPLYAGSYPVTATVDDPMYIGTASNTFIVTKAAAVVLITNLSQTYNGAGKAAQVFTSPTGLNLVVTYNGSASYPTNAGSYTVVATINNSNYQGSATNTLVINPASATLNLSGLAQTYDGAAKSATVTTVPAGLGVNVTYNGSTNAPRNTGSYTVVATVNDTNYQGSATNTLVIAPSASAPITLGGSSILSDGTFQLSFTNTPGATFSVLGSADPTAPVADWTVLGNAVEVSPGQFQFIDLEATNEALQFYRISSP